MLPYSSCNLVPARSSSVSEEDTTEPKNGETQDDEEEVPEAARVGGILEDSYSFSAESDSSLPHLSERKAASYQL